MPDRGFEPRQIEGDHYQRHIPLSQHVHRARKENTPIYTHSIEGANSILFVLRNVFVSVSIRLSG